MPPCPEISADAAPTYAFVRPSMPPPRPQYRERCIMEHALSPRRPLLKAGLLIGGGLMLGLRLPGPARAAVPEDVGQFVPNAFVRIDTNGAITLIMPHTEFGQGIYTSSAMLMGEELEVGLDQIQVEPAPPDLKKYMNPLLFDQATGGSASTRADWIRLRQAAATA